MKISELQLGDIVSCLGDPVRVVSLSLKGDEPIEIISPLKTIETFREEDVKPIPLTAAILEKNGFRCDTIGSGLILHIDNSENRYVFVSFRHDGSSRHVEIEDGYYNLSVPVSYLHELQHALRLVGLNNLAKNLKV